VISSPKLEGVLGNLFSSAYELPEAAIMANKIREWRLILLNVPEKLLYHKPNNSMEDRYVITQAVAVQREDSSIESMVLQK
jgi:hypothetical protein